MWKMADASNLCWRPTAFVSSATQPNKVPPPKPPAPLHVRSCSPTNLKDASKHMEPNIAASPQEDNVPNIEKTNNDEIVGKIGKP